MSNEKEISREFYDEKEFYSEHIVPLLDQARELCGKQKIPFCCMTIVSQKEEGYESAVMLEMAGPERTPQQVIPVVVAMKGEDGVRVVPDAFIEQATVAFSILQQLMQSMPKELAEEIAAKMNSIMDTSGLKEEEVAAAKASPKFALA